MADWSRVLWTDESKFNFHASDGVRFVRRKPGERHNLNCLRGTVKHGDGDIMYGDACRRRALDGFSRSRAS